MRIEQFLRAKRELKTKCFEPVSVDSLFFNQNRMETHALDRRGDRFDKNNELNFVEDSAEFHQRVVCWKRNLVLVEQLFFLFFFFCFSSFFASSLFSFSLFSISHSLYFFPFVVG